MKKTTSEKLSKRLLKYGAFSAAILGTANASGQIVYTDIADETVDPTSARYAIDINNDGTGDYLFGASTTADFTFIFPASSSMAPAYNTNLMVGFSSGAYNYPSNLTAGTTIDGTSPTFGNARGDFNYGSCNYSNSQFCDGNDGYIGFSFTVDTDTFYGWARIQVAASGASVIIKDYAYNSTPDGAIDAGQTLGVNDFNEDTIKIITQDKNISLFNLPSSTDYRLFDISGKTILNGQTKSENHIIQASSLSNGIYIIELTDSNSDAVIRKKIVL